LTSNQNMPSRKGALAFLALISAFPPLSTVLYLPALPQMVEVLDTTQASVNMTLSMFFLFYSAGLLFWGPLSEKFGRKPILLSGLTIYIFASVFCAFSQNVEQLIAGRIIQALGGSAGTVVATAIVKDLYSGREREKVMATIMSMVIIAPMVSPVLGALLLKYASWRTIFLMLAAVGTTALLAGMLFRETLSGKYTGSVIGSWYRLFVVLKNPGFSSLLLIFSLAPIALMAFLASASYIYIDGFALTEGQFSLFFTFNATCAMVGPTIYMRMRKHIEPKLIITGSFTLIAVCGVIVSAFGHISPWLLSLSVGPVTMAVIMVRVPGTHLMLEQQEEDSGSASALINFFAMFMGSMGMQLVTLWPGTLIANLGNIQIGVGVVCCILWLLCRNRPFILQPPS
jgi:DHA1 family bicyclomycin/chloramphenicol resistance-like MFS transporter